VETLATEAATNLYFSEMTFSIPQGAVVADGLDSGATGLEVLGQGLAGPVRQYRGSEIGTGVTSNDLGTVFATPGSVDYPVLSFTMKTAINFEQIAVTELEFRSTGTLNDATQISNASLWRDDGTRRGRVDRALGGVVEELDVLLQENVTFTMDDGTIVFDNLNVNVTNGTVNYLLAFDISGSAADGATFQVSMPTARSVDGMGAATLAPARHREPRSDRRRPDDPAQRVHADRQRDRHPRGEGPQGAAAPRRRRRSREPAHRVELQRERQPERAARRRGGAHSRDGDAERSDVARLRHARQRRQPGRRLHRSERVRLADADEPRGSRQRSAARLHVRSPARRWNCAPAAPR
jgi:hypothetical protein